EVEAGQKTIHEYTRYLTVLICLIQAFFVVQSFMRPESAGGQGWAKPGYGGWYWPTMIITLTAGTIFLMWLGEQIDEYGVGNGISLIIMAGLLAPMPPAVRPLVFETAAAGGRVEEGGFPPGGPRGSGIPLQETVGWGGGLGRGGG